MQSAVLIPQEVGDRDLRWALADITWRLAMAKQKSKRVLAQRWLRCELSPGWVPGGGLADETMKPGASLASAPTTLGAGLGAGLGTGLG